MNSLPVTPIHHLRSPELITMHADGTPVRVNGNGGNREEAKREEREARQHGLPDLKGGIINKYAM